MSFVIGDRVVNTEKNLEGVITAIPAEETKVTMYLVQYDNGTIKAVPESKLEKK